MMTLGCDSENDVVQVTAPDAHWMRVDWTITRRSIERAKAALGTEWYSSVAVLRVEDVSGSDHESGTTPHVLQDIELSGTSPVWFVAISDPERAYRFSLGYRKHGQGFFVVARSKPVVPARLVARNARSSVPPDPALDPDAATRGMSPGQWIEEFEKDAESPPGSGRKSNSSSRLSGSRSKRAAQVSVTVTPELLVGGQATPGATLRVSGKVVPTAPDGRFSTRIPLGSGRGVIPVEVSAADRSATQTVLLTIESGRRELGPRTWDDEI
jgi:hypothetical protein